MFVVERKLFAKGFRATDGPFSKDSHVAVAVTDLEVGQQNAGQINHETATPELREEFGIGGCRVADPDLRGGVLFVRRRMLLLLLLLLLLL